MFKVGDKVRLVTKADMDEHLAKAVTIGRVYIVREIDRMSIKIENDLGRHFSYYAYRFVLAGALNYKGERTGGSLC